MTETSLATALSEAVARMEQNRSASTALAAPAGPRPMVGLRADPVTGAAILPKPVALPPPDAALQRVLGMARAEIAAPRQGLPLVAPAAVRAAAGRYAAFVAEVLAPGAEPDLIREWLDRWAPRCRRQAGEDYAEAERGFLLAIEDLPAIAFCEETAKEATRRFEWLPAPAVLHRLLQDWLAPYHAALAEARAVATAQDPEPAARERPADAPLSEDEIAERRAAVARTMDRFRADMAALRERQKAAAGGGKPAKVAPHYLGEFQLALALRQQIAMAPTPEALATLQMRLDVLLQRNPRVADLLTPAHPVHPA